MLPFLHTMSMRRTDRQQSEKFGRALLTKSEYGVLSLATFDGIPYAIPISFALVGQTIYLHGSLTGTKLSIIAENPRVTFTCVGRTRVLAREFSTEYESVIVVGDARIVTDMQERLVGFMALAEKYSPDFHQEAHDYITRMGNQSVVLAITITHITAKAKLPPEESHI